jgi:hypothetical protein
MPADLQSAPFDRFGTHPPAPLSVSESETLKDIGSLTPRNLGARDGRM